MNIVLVNLTFILRILILQVKHPNFKFWYTLDRPPGAWKYSTGFVSIEMIESHLPAPGKDTLILMCGPPPMLKFACIPSLEKLGYTEEMHFSF
jgi:cytochrome-b5 reductase